MQYSQSHNVCVYETKVPERILTLLPSAKMVGDSVAVPCNLGNMRTMAALGYPALSPILTKYDWPGRFKPYIHQRHIAAFLTLNPRSFNLSDIGTGKTMATLWAADYLMRLGVVKKAIIISPLSTLRRVWQNEIFGNFLSRRSCVVLHGSRQERLRLLRTAYDFYIINHDGLGVGSKRGKRGIELGDLATEVALREDINLIIVDEGSVYKDGGTTRAKILRRVAKDKPYVWWLTGTPAPNSPVDVHSQARIVRKDYEESFNSFQDRVTTKITAFKRVPKREGATIAAQTLQPAIIYKREECIDLPPVTFLDRDAEMTPKQKELYATLRKDALAQMQGGAVITAVNEAVLRMKFLQVAMGALYDSEHEVHKIDCAPRLAALREAIEETNRKILIFAPLTSVVNLIYSELKKDHSVECITGGVSAGKRDRIFQAFQQEQDPRIIVADPGTMAHGLTLTEANMIVWYGPTDKPEVYTQANGRINRPGQKHDMLIVRLAATKIEREIYERLDNKQSMQGLTLNLIKQGDL